MPKESATSDRFAEVAAETGYPIHEVRSRGITFCRNNPRGRGDDFDQTFPDSFETDVVEANASDAERLIAEAQAARLPFGALDAPMSPARQKLIILRREAAKGGVKFVGSIGGDDVLNSATFSDDEADALEPAYRDALHTLAISAPGLASHA